MNDSLDHAKSSDFVQEGSIRLIEPTMEYAEDIWRFRQEILSSNDKDKFAGCGNLEACLSVKEWIDTINLHKNAQTCPKDRVPSRIYIAVREKDNRIVGIIDLRYHINTPVLSTWGGHMGYYVRPDERKKGYAREMVRQNLQNFKNMNIRKVMVTCIEDNT
ncbi:MAG: GNAT family N-acetyltransferase, partial [Lachnospiraceae bacterium]|nr:GNAT family N-acetyltransferase [Lachnospiraceae bacterium]